MNHYPNETPSHDLPANNRNRFKLLQEFELEIPWQKLVKLIEPHYFEASIGRNLITADTMLKIYFLQLRYGMNPSGIEEALFQIEVLRDFCHINMVRDIIPSETCIARFSQLIVEKNLEHDILDTFGLTPIKQN